MDNDDHLYDEAYWQSMDGGLGVQGSTMWEDIAHILFELFGVSSGGDDISGSMSVLDMGCGYGLLVEQLRRRGFEAFGTDLSSYALEQAPKSVAQYLQWHDMAWVDDTFFGREKFDLVVSTETLEHIDEEFSDRALLHIYHSLKPRGRALLTICTDDRAGWDVDPTHKTIRSRGWWEKKLNKLFLPIPKAVEYTKMFYLFSRHNGVFVLERRDPSQIEGADNGWMDF